MYDRYRFPEAGFMPVCSGQKRPPERPSGGLGNLLSHLRSLFHDGIDTEDILLIGLLLLLYMDSKDEDFLIFLAAVVLSMLQND